MLMSPQHLTLILTNKFLNVFWFIIESILLFNFCIVTPWLNKSLDIISSIASGDLLSVISIRSVGATAVGYIPEGGRAPDLQINATKPKFLNDIGGGLCYFL